MRNPKLLLKLAGMEVPREIVRKAHELLEEVKFEEEVFRRR